MYDAAPVEQAGEVAPVTTQAPADFVAPKGIPDWIGAFAVTAGIGIEAKLAEFEAACASAQQAAAVSRERSNRVSECRALIALACATAARGVGVAGVAPTTVCARNTRTSSILRV